MTHLPPQAVLRSSHQPPSLFFPPNLLRSHTSIPKTLTLTLNKKTKLYVSCRHSDYFEQQRVAPRAKEERSFAVQSPATQPTRVYAGYSIYKGKAALSVEPKPPEFAPLDSGAFKVSKEGFVLLQFAPAVVARQYDWNRKQVFSLSVGEIGTLIGLGAKDGCEFFHDPFKGKSEEGKIRKVLKVEPLPDSTGHFFNLNVQNRLLNVDESIYIPIARAELIVMNSIFNFILPYLLGWHAFADNIKAEDSIRSNFTSTRSGPELEWGR
ncbi:single-stranded DNA-binding protein WHY1, chloroplastic-like [Phalaenopsis equestris]|uniref:single-stranded DNA-binding protein WHY1, chloroplastic-like n=1 Tax=Phalaenopsis equestris TaxID=78828 RepID=UPI0009E5EBB0|nr:single-stranded DNA-binding protein WHY1, chloroplastic-like [Phalaenopsis equestris]